MREPKLVKSNRFMHKHQETDGSGTTQQLMWCSKFFLTAYAWPHFRQTYGLSPVWVLSCICKVCFCIKPLPHVWQTNGLSPVWILWCIIKWEFLINLLPHIWQRYGLSPVWVLLCFTKSDFMKKTLAAYGANMWTLTCVHGHMHF